MSLQVWLPLTKDLRNQGLSNVAVTNNGATFNSAGKLGGCYYFNKSNTNYLKFSIPFTTPEEISTTFWIKIPSAVSGNCQITNIGTSAGWVNIRFGVLIRFDTTQLIFHISDGSNVLTYTVISSALPTETWIHVACTYKNKIMKIYLNGILNKTYTTNFIPSFSGISEVGIGAAPNGSEPSTIYLNDYRLYDHCLSEKEVKEISKGLVLHYPLNRNGLGAINLVKNGFGELNTENWENSNIYTDVPSSDTTIKKSYKNNSTIEYIPIYRNQTYTFSTWVKADQSTGYSYPSLWPYDVDKKFIQNYHCKNGFNLNTMTTLSRQLNPGDTKVYVNDLSQWNANSGHYYNWAAVFGYEDSTGYTYPDGVYTQNTLRFATSTTEKTNLDKTNNIITLLSAYNGPIIPVGTSVCASTEGSTYFYPVGGIANSTITDWTFKTGSFSSEDNRLANARYVRIYAYSLCYQAGITLKNNTIDNIDNNIEYDISGYCNNGTRIGNFSWTDDTPRYCFSTYMPAAATISHTRCLDNTNQEWSCAAWVKPKVAGNYQYLNNFNESNSLYYGTYPLLYLNSGTNDYYNYGNLALPINQWSHIVFVFKNSTGTKLIYVNGENHTNTSGPNKTSTPRGIPDTVIIGGNNYEGGLCDYREYATALSTEDVFELYQQKGYANSFEGNNLIYYEYIQNNDLTQYIDLQTSLVNKTVEVKFQQTPLVNKVNTIYGGEDGATPWYAYGFRFNSGTAYLYLNGNLDTTGVDNSITTPAPDENIHIFRGIHKINQKSSATLDGEALPVVETIPNKFSTRTALLFATKGLGNPGGLKNNNLNLRIYYFKIWDENDNLTHYLRPCSYNGHTGMWNEINNTFYPNCGKGEFTCGNIIEN